MCAAILSIAPINGLEQQTDQNDECPDALHMHSDCPVSLACASSLARVAFAVRSTKGKLLSGRSIKMATVCIPIARTAKRTQRRRDRERSVARGT
jgi:hypothetical protein